ncbi:hypothetical protein ACOACO_17520 [Nocardioides sp. CPCC 205120]|uniref:hypothetical protein n=1 Tax=Nocardioides sp. CPCC 205120 TaxID=3406462 RepID=UPI003B50FFEF
MPDNPRGWEHQQVRARLLPDAYGTPCPRCGKPMLKGQDLDLGHTVDVADGATGPGDRIEHTSCNRSDGATAQQRRSQFNPSREW